MVFPWISHGFPYQNTMLRCRAQGLERQGPATAALVAGADQGAVAHGVRRELQLGPGCSWIWGSGIWDLGADGKIGFIWFNIMLDKPS